MRLRNGRTWLVLALALTAWALTGCSSTPPPCNVQPEQVDQARSDYQAAQAAAADAAAEIKDLEGQITQAKSKVVSADELQQLEVQLEKLKKGSGR